jgi:hypothetical protein
LNLRKRQLLIDQVANPFFSRTRAMGFFQMVADEVMKLDLSIEKKDEQIYG